MAHKIVVGVPKRDPCRKCGMPVFLAERCTVGRYLYHRSCLKCARCSTQLTLGSFYETEIDAEYCCDICPDEEVIRTEYDGVDAVASKKRFSELLDKFQSDGEQLLRKPVSDEEKTQSLKRLNDVVTGRSIDRQLFLNAELTMGEEIIAELSQPPDTDGLNRTPTIDLRTVTKEAPIDQPNIDSGQKSDNVETTESSDSDSESECDSDNLTNISSEQSDVKVEFSESKTVSSSALIKDNELVDRNKAIDETLDINLKSQTDELVVLLENNDKVIESHSLDLNNQDNGELNSPVAPPIRETLELDSLVSPSKPETVELNSTVCQSEPERVKFDSAVLNPPEPVELNSTVVPPDPQPVKLNSDEPDVETGELTVPVCPPKRRTIELSSSADIPEITVKPPDTSNPFDSSDDEVELLKDELNKKVVPTKRISTNPFGSDEEDDDVSITPVPVIRTPVPTPRKTLYRGDEQNIYGNSSIYSSTTSIASSDSNITMSASKRKKGPAPKPPNELPIRPNRSNESTPKPIKSKRRAPIPPPRPEQPPDIDNTQQLEPLPEQSKIIEPEFMIDQEVTVEPIETNPNKKIIPLDDSLLNDSLTGMVNEPVPSIDNDSDVIQKSLPSTESLDENVVYRRMIIPTEFDSELLTGESHERQLEKIKENKESQNKNRQSQLSFGDRDRDRADCNSINNKQDFGKWKRRKGPAPALPIPPRRILQMLPLQEIRHELEVIEVQQQGLEKQGVVLEKMIRERCEGLDDGKVEDNQSGRPSHDNVSKEAESLIMQLFELVNEKNELFRRQAELMYLRRQHRLEQEQADIEYEIRFLMAQPERNKTDTDKAREETLIARLMEVVQLRNEVIDRLEQDRLREAAEDESIQRCMEQHSAQQNPPPVDETPVKLSKKEKRRQKEEKKLAKQKKKDADKDYDDTEVEREKPTKRKRDKIFGLKSMFH